MYKVEQRSIESIRRFDKNKAGWFLTSEDPYYFFREKDNGEYEAISLFLADDVVVLEHHEIDLDMIPEDIKEEYTNNISEGLRINEEFATIDILEQSLNNGFGDIIHNRTFYKSECDELNEFLENIQIGATFSEDSF